MINATAFPARAASLPQTPVTARPFSVVMPGQRLLLYANASGTRSHLQHDLAVAARFLDTDPRRQLVLLTGQAPVDGLPLPRGVSVVHLPAVGDSAGGVRHSLPERLVRRARAAIIADIARRFAPDVVLVDSAPEGPIDAELAPAIAELRHQRPALTVIVGLGQPRHSPAPAHCGEVCGSTTRPLSLVTSTPSSGRSRRAPEAVPA